MKQIFAIFLVLCCLLGLCACGGGNGSAGDNSGGTQGGKLASSLDFALTAKSYQLTLTGETSAGREVQERMQVATDSSGKQTILLDQWRGDDTFTADSYYCGTVGYTGNGKELCDSGFTAEEVLLRKSYWNLAVLKDVLKNIENMKPEASTKDGNTVFTVNKVTLDQYIAVGNLMSGTPLVKSELEKSLEGMGNPELRFTVTVDGAGNFKSFQIGIIGVSTGGPKTNRYQTYEISRVGEIESIAQPDMAKNFQLQEYHDLICWVNGQAAVYSYQAVTPDGPVLWFKGMGYKYFDSYTVDCYEIPAVVDGIPVKGVLGVINNTNNSVQVRKVVVPAGLAFIITEQQTPCGCLYPSAQTDFYLYEEESAADKTALQAGVQAKNVYYAGQWEMVGGVPTAK